MTAPGPPAPPAGGEACRGPSGRCVGRRPRAVLGGVHPSSGRASPASTRVPPVLSGPWIRVATALVVFAFLAGCSNGDQTSDMTRDAAIYRSVIIDVVDRSGVDLQGEGDLPVLFVEALGPDGIPLEVQVELVSGFVEEYEIRFIDDFDEAVEAELPGLPVREGSLLIGLGDVDVEETAEVHSEVYLRTDDVRGFGYTLVDLGGLRWDIVGGPVDAEADGLTPTP